ncbi:hypothetical protein TNCV_2702241 [Trichonephila clavipes]|nr:hypothetical protein TNCV_2702241 [Trichonephila clavipes]
MYSSALSIEIISDVDFSRRLVESRSDKLKQVKSKKNNSTRPHNSKIKANAGEKQLNSSVGTKQLNSTGENNSTRQHERNNSTQQQERNNSTLHCRRPPAPPLQQAGGIIGQYFFKNDEGHNVTVNGDRYRAMITNFFIPELNNHDVQELWFQQDGATYHTARATIDLLKDTFGDRLISRFGPVNWPPRSCDLTHTARLFSVGLCKVIGLCG